MKNDKLSSKQPQMLHPRAVTKQRDWSIMWLKCKHYKKFKISNVLLGSKTYLFWASVMKWYISDLVNKSAIIFEM